MEIIVKEYLTDQITERQFTKILQVSNSQLTYINEEKKSYKFGESSLTDTMDRIKLFLG